MLILRPRRSREGGIENEFEFFSLPSTIAVTVARMSPLIAGHGVQPSLGIFALCVGILPGRELRSQRQLNLQAPLPEERFGDVF